MGSSSTGARRRGGLAAPTGRAAGGGGSAGPALDLYRITASPAAVDRLERDGFDVAASRADGTTEVVLGPGELARLKAPGFRRPGGGTARAGRWPT